MGPNVAGDVLSAEQASWLSGDVIFPASSYAGAVPQRRDVFRQ